MRSPLRTQIYWPIAGLLTLSVLLLTVISAWYAARNSDRQTRQHMQAITDALGNASYPLTSDVVRRIGAMTGGEIVVFDRDGNVASTTTGDSESLRLLLSELPVTDAASAAPQRIRWNANDWLVSAISRTHVLQPGTLFVMLPTDDFFVLWRNAILPPLAVIVPFLILALGLALVISRRIAQRIDQVRSLFRRLASGDFQPVPVSGRNDEIRDLIVSANELSDQLRDMQQHLVVSERLQLLGQLSGGLAHQLRNSITGARLAIQLHHKKQSGSDEMIETAIAQLNLTEEQIMAVISLRPDSNDAPEPADTDLGAMIRDVSGLLQPLCSHWNSTLSIRLPTDIVIPLRSPRSVKGALLNLVQNAVEAAGVDGCVSVTASQTEQHADVDILDSGPGFPDGMSPMTDAFQSTKPDGIGLGLTIAQHAVDQESGQLIIGEQHGQTAVTLRLPVLRTHALAGSHQ